MVMHAQFATGDKVGRGNNVTSHTPLCVCACVCQACCSLDQNGRHSRPSDQVLSTETNKNVLGDMLRDLVESSHR